VSAGGGRDSPTDAAAWLFKQGVAVEVKEARAAQ